MELQLSDSNELYKGTVQGEQVTGGRGNDIIATGEGNDVITDGEGNDLLIGGGGDDSLLDLGMAGKDTLVGGAGNDTLGSLGGVDILVGGAGDDFLNSGLGVTTATGGTGNDEFGFASGAFTSRESRGRTTITDFNVQEDRFVSQEETDQFSDLKFSTSQIRGASTDNVVFDLPGVDTSELTTDNFSGFVGSFDDISR